MKTFFKNFTKNKGATVALFLLICFLFVAIFAPLLAPYSPNEIFEDAYKLQPMSYAANGNLHLLGTDDIGRDFLSRLIYGTRVSFGVGLMVVVLDLIFGLLLGVSAGYFGGKVDAFIMRLVDVIMSLPSILLAIVIVALLGPSLINGIIAVSVVALPNFIRIIRAAVMAEKQKSYVMANTNFGASHFRKAVLNILPNCLAPIIVQTSLGFSDGILNVAALGFLGMGAQAPTPEWGVMLTDSKDYLETASWLVTMPGLCILVLVLCFNLMGDGLRDALDPKLRGSD